MYKGAWYKTQPLPFPDLLADTPHGTQSATVRTVGIIGQAKRHFLWGHS